jgi:type VI secretion system protein ImpA
MRLDLSPFLGARSDESPSGDNLEYDPAFIDLEIAAQPGEERQAGEAIIAAEEPDYRNVIEKAVAVLERSHDLRAAGHLALAVLRTEGLPGFAEAVGYIRHVVTEFWDSCHPQLDAEDDNDPTMRVNAVRMLVDPDGILRALRLAPLTNSRAFGRFSLRDIAIASGEMALPAGMDTAPDLGAIAAAFEDTDDATGGALQGAARASLDHVRAIGAKFDEMVPGQGPDFDALIRLLRQISSKLSEASGDAPAAESDEAHAIGLSAAAPEQRGARGPLGEISSPADVLAALDRIMAYYARQEPSSPVPLLLARAKRLVGADFMTIMQDMAPSGLDTVQIIGGLDR